MDAGELFRMNMPHTHVEVFGRLDLFMLILLRVSMRFTHKSLYIALGYGLVNIADGLQSFQGDHLGV